MTSFRQTVEKAADKAGLSIKNPVAANAYLLLAWTVIEWGQLKLPHGGLAVLSEVAKERTGHAIPTGSLRWYRVQLLKEPSWSRGWSSCRLGLICWSALARQHDMLMPTTEKPT